MKTCVIMQPTYLPWLGYFDLIRSSDVFVFLDHVQFSKQSWQQRNRIRNKEGELILTMPVLNSSTKKTSIKDVVIDLSKNPFSKHFKTIQHCYSKSLNYLEIIEELEILYCKNHSTLKDVNIDFILYGCDKLNSSSNFVFSSELDVNGNRVDALVDICKKVGAERYLSPLGSAEYINVNNVFEESNIVLDYQKFEHPIYPQCNYRDFISHLSFIDYLFNVPK